MKKTIGVAAVVLLVAALAWGGFFLLYPVAADACPPSVMIDGTTYYAFSEKYDVTPTQDQISGYIRSCVDISGMPKKDDQSNFPACVDQPYAFVEGQLLLYYSGQWNLCELP